VRRADRLFEIIQHLRRRPTTRARDLADALEVSERTIYRDIRDLMASGVPIEGEAGVGYVLRAGFDLPPLMFKEQEIEALVLGARIVESWADNELAEAASDAIAKIEAVIPERLRGYMANTALLAPSLHFMEPIAFDLADLRRAIRNRRKIRFRYTDVVGQGSERTVRPLSLATSDRSGCSPHGASSATTSAPSASTGWRTSPLPTTFSARSPAAPSPTSSSAPTPGPAAPSTPTARTAELSGCARPSPRSPSVPRAGRVRGARPSTRPPPPSA
jgi:biotin operon repressor